MDELQLVRSLLLRTGRGVPASAPLAKALTEWAAPHYTWLGVRADRKDGWRALLRAAASGKPCADPLPHVLTLAHDLAGALAFDAFDANLLTVMVAVDRLSRLATLATVAARHGMDLPALLGELAGADAHDAVRLVRRSPLLRLGLVNFRANRQGIVEVDIGWTLERLLDRAPTLEDGMIDMLVGTRQPARLTLEDFGASPDIDFVARLLKGAVAERAEGVNILIHGPPGTGKTELARALAASVGAALHAVGEADVDGDEPDRRERVDALRLAQRLLARSGGTVLLFDEMEDLIGDAAPSGGDWFARRSGSKIFVNRLLEANPVPVIWTTNAIGNIDNAILRRMSFVLKMGLPSRAQGIRVLAKVAADEQVTPGAGFDRLLDAAPEAATVLRVAARAGRLAGEADGGVRSAEALVRALRGCELAPGDDDLLDLDLFETDLPLGRLIGDIVDRGALDVSLLLTGPPGTGKTALAAHLARALDRPLLVKRASDLLSCWVGGTEKAIAEAFGEARERQGVLFFDEVDSLLFDRSTAQRSWEVTQVNELLTWLDHHPMPVLAATNHGHKLDPATLRRFVFKLELRPLNRDQAARAFERFFGMVAPADLATLTNLTPGDFAVVKRGLRFRPLADTRVILDALAVEVAAKPEMGTRIGFG